MNDNPHEDHRKRVKQEFLLRGFDEKTPPHKVLELLLFYCVPRVDTNPLAHELIARYKTLSGVLDAPVEELVTFKGITMNNVGLLKMIMPLARIYQTESRLNGTGFGGYEEMCEYIVDRFMGITEERFAVMHIDSFGKMLEFSFISGGDANNVMISNRDLLESVIRNKTAAVVVAHNHHNGLPLPSDQDVIATERIADVLASVDVKLIDHIIISRNEYVSMALSKSYKYIFNKERIV